MAKKRSAPASTTTTKAKTAAAGSSSSKDKKGTTMGNAPTNPGGKPKQQSIVDSMAKSALKRKDKGSAAKQPKDEEEEMMDTVVSDEDDDPMDGSNATGNEFTMSQWKRRPVLAVGGGQSSRQADHGFNEDENEEEERKSEERGPRRTTRVVSSSQRLGRGASGDGSLDHIVSGSYLLSAGNSTELSRRLKQTWAALQQIPNQQHQDATMEVPLEKLRLLCAELLNDKIMDHGEKNVRSLAACCFVEFLRVFAPDMPFKSNEELYDAFQLILEQLRCLAMEGHDDATAASKQNASSTDLHYLYILESLASVKSCLLLLGMDYIPEESDDTLLVQLFRVLFNTIRKEHSAKIENMMVSILVACIEESDSIEQPLLDVILSPLVHANQSPLEATMATAADATGSPSERGPYHMAQELIRRTSDHLQSHLSHFFNSVLVDAPTMFMNKTSELKEHVYTLIYEVHKINSSLLLYVLPNVCMQLQVDEVATRSEAIALMGRLFASSHADYGHDYMKNFRDFLGRFRDVSKEIRLQMVQVSAIIWQRKPELAALIEKEFIARLSDPEWEVRRLTVNEVCDLAANNLDVVSEECLRQVGERMKDKRVVLRKETMTGLSQVYAAHIASYWAPSTEEEDEEEDETSKGISIGNSLMPTGNVKKLGWVPDYVLKCFAYPQQELKLRVIQLLDDILLPKALSEVVRAKGLLFIYHSLDATSREALRRVFVERAKCQTIVESFLSVRKIARRSSSDAKHAEAMMEKAKDAFLAGIASLFSETDNLGKLLDQLVKWKDQSVFKQLELLCDCSKSQQEYRSARDRMVKSVGSKTPLGEFLKNFCRKLNMLTISEATLSVFLGFFVGTGLPHHRENRSVTDLLLIVSRTTPQLVGRFVQDEMETILTQNDDSAPSKAKTADNADKDEDDAEDDEDEDVEKDYKVIISLLTVLSEFSHYWKKRQLETLDDLDRQATDSMPSNALKNYLKQCCLGVAVKNSSAQDDGAPAKFAAQVLANFFGDSKDIGVLVSKLCSKKMLVATNVTASVSTLHSLHEFCKRCPLQLHHHPDNVANLWQALMDNYIQPQANSEPTKLKKSGKNNGVTASKTAEMRCLAIKVASDLLLYCHDGDSSKLLERSKQLVQLLFDLLRSDGRLWASSGSLPVKYRIAAACNLVKLLRHRTIESSLTVAEWHILGFVMQDAVEEVRKAFVKKLSSNLMKNAIPHPHKYLSFLVLAATETNAILKKNARGLLIAAVERMRRVFEATSARPASQSTGDNDDADGDRQNVNALMVPEYALPYVIHLLAHHPDFPASTAKKAHASGQRNSLFTDPTWSDQVAYMSFFLDGLMPPNSVEADNIAFLLQIVTKLSDCHDVLDAKSVAMYPLIECAVGLLKRRIKNQSNLKSFPGKIYLPKQLFSAGKSTDSRRSSAGKSTREQDDGQAEPTKKKSRVMASLSPIKAAGISSTFIEMQSPPASAQKQRRPSPVPSSGKTKRKSLSKSTPALPPTPSARDDEDAAIETPSRRQSFMRKARAQTKTFVDMSSESEDDSDCFVPRASVASRVDKRESVGSVRSVARKSVDESASSQQAESDGEKTSPTTPQQTPPTKRRRGAAAKDEEDEETKGQSASEASDNDDMPSFRAPRRRRKA